MGVKAALLFHVGGGRVRRLDYYTDRERAFADLAESSAPPGNVDLVKSILADWDRGDFSSSEWADPEIESAFVGGPTPGRWKGLAGLLDSSREFFSAWREFRVEAEEFHQLDDERVFVLHRFCGRGKTSGLELAQMRAKGALLFELHGGKVTRLVRYFDRATAFADLDLASEGRAGPAPDNVEVVRQILDAVACRDLSRMLALTDPDVELRSFFAIGEQGAYRGHEALRQYVEDLDEAFDFLRPEPQGLLEFGDVVVGIGRIHYRGKESGLETEASVGWMFKFRAGKLVRFRAFRDPEQALENVGLSE
jgi:ketosteroid isomerase-like protein